jgi:hypothetical protein
MEDAEVLMLRKLIRENKLNFLVDDCKVELENMCVFNDGIIFNLYNKDKEEEEEDSEMEPSEKILALIELMKSFSERLDKLKKKS